MCAAERWSVIIIQSIDREQSNKSDGQGIIGITNLGDNLITSHYCIKTSTSLANGGMWRQHTWRKCTQNIELCGRSDEWRRRNGHLKYITELYHCTDVSGGWIILLFKLARQICAPGGGYQIWRRTFLVGFGARNHFFLDDIKSIVQNTKLLRFITLLGRQAQITITHDYLTTVEKQRMYHTKQNYSSPSSEEN